MGYGTPPLRCMGGNAVNHAVASKKNECFLNDLTSETVSKAASLSSRVYLERIDP